MDSVTAAVHHFRADTVAVVNCAQMDSVRLRELSWALEMTGTDLCVAPALIDLAGPRTTIRPVAGLPLVHLDHANLTGPQRIVKGIFDRTLAASALILLSPLLLGIACAIHFSDGGPVLFRHLRIGKDGRPFHVYKFRSMVVDAEARKADLESVNEVNGVLFKIRRDPRLTPMGGWLRRWSIDEVPQLLNVLHGEMSMVGPRPWAVLPYEKAVGAEGHVPRRLAVKPGLTGLWQVSGRANLPWEESVRLDLRYVEHWSLTLDLQIMWKTARAVARGTGAYCDRDGPERAPRRLTTVTRRWPARARCAGTLGPAPQPGTGSPPRAGRAGRERPARRQLRSADDPCGSARAEAAFPGAAP
jgi:exopolysaccharide biosynthesis polyprenyl glycosylphosphotransferase